MNYKIIKKEAFSIFGVEEIFSTENGENLKKIPQFWQRAIKDGTIDRIATAAGAQWDDTCRGIVPVNAVMCHRDTEGNTFPYMLFAFTPKDKVPEGFSSAEIPEMTWAVFTSEEHTDDKTTVVIQALWKRIYSEWFPTSNYEHIDGPEFEMYGVADNGKSYCEVWIPVAKKRF